jgi:pimeloyl-ACP methyl ester carboxylesterase
MTNRDTVVCVHGIWGKGVEMALMKRRLEKDHGFRVLLFSYPSVRGSLDGNAAKLARFIAEQGLERAHLVGHSLGGVIALRMLATSSNTPPGRVVCIGSPLTGSRPAAILAQKNWAKPMLGQSLPAAVVHSPASEWAAEVSTSREVGIIAGVVPVGFGRLVTKFDGDNDGSVAVSETRLPGATDHICLRVSHKSILVSREVVDQVAAFLRHGKFTHNIDRPTAPQERL